LSPFAVVTGATEGWRHHEEASDGNHGIPTTDRRHIPERRHVLNITRSSSLSALDWTAMVLMVIGAINWGLVGALNVNLVSALFGEQTALTRVVYALVGLAGLYGVYLLAKFAQR
jgi:uncharacterized membrane protein YuzA (DUF378 family)